jgi:hypothetical protein
MLARNGLLPPFDIEKLGLAVNPLELECLRIDPLAFHLTAYNRAFKGHYAQIMAICSLDDDKVTCPDALTRSILVYTLSCILETDFKKVLELLLTHSCKPVIDFKLAAPLTVCTLDLATLGPLDYTSARTVIFL